MGNNIHKTINRIIEYGLYLLVFLLPIQTRWIIRAGELNGGYWEYGTISLYATDILLVLLLALFVVVKLNSKFVSEKPQHSLGTRIRNLKLDKVWYLIAGLDIIIFISIFFAPDKTVSIFSYFRFLLGVGLFFLIVKANFRILVLIYSFLAGILLQAVLGIWQFLSQSGFACKWLGMAIHDPGILGTSVVEILSGERWLRAYGGLDHPNMLGGLLVVGLLLSIGMIIISRGNDYQKSRIRNIILFTIVCLLFTALFFTFSRGAWAGLIAGFLMMLFILIIKRDRIGQKFFLAIISGLFVLVFIFFNLYGDLVLTRLSVDTRLEAKSLNERVLSNAVAGKIIKNRWFIGTGIGNYTNYLSNKYNKNQPAYYYQPVHNVFLLIFAEIGIIGLLFFIGLLIFVYYLLLNKTEWRVYRIYQLPVLTAIIIICLADHWWWSLHFGVFLFWLCVGLVNRRHTYKS